MSVTAPVTAPDAATGAAPTAPAGDRVPARRRRLRRALGVVGAAVAVLALWPLGLLAGADYVITDPTGSARIDWSVAAGFTLGVGLLGWAVLALLERVTRHGTRAWAVLAILVVVASEVPVVLVDATTATRVALAVLHVVVGAVLVPARR